MILTSPSFEEEMMIPKKFSCEGGNINPELIIQNVPEEARSLALIMHDPDAPYPDKPMPDGFTHWVVWNIPPTTSVIKQESVPPGAKEGKSGKGVGYIGPCPPADSPAHRYEFRLYALDTVLDLPEGTTDKAALESAMDGHIIEQATLTGFYSAQGGQERNGAI